MQSKIVFLSSIIGALGVLTCIQALPIEVVYAGDTCECPKKLDYELNMPIPPIPHPNIPFEHNYRIEYPLKAKNRVFYSFDFDVEQPEPKIPIPEPKMDMYAKVDRVTSVKKDCYTTQELPRTCGCYRRGSSSRYVLPESKAIRITRNPRHPNSLDSTDTEPSAQQMPPATKIVAIFFKPAKQPIWNISKPRNKRDISRIFTKPSKNQKRSDRVVKQYTKRLKDIGATGARTSQGDRRSRALDTTSDGLLPLQKLGSLFKLPRLRNKRDIKGEYDLIEKEREQMDLTLPEIIQYMPETLNPNFKRNQCNFAQSCSHKHLTQTTVEGTTAALTTAPSETTETEQVTTSKTPKNEMVANGLPNEGREEKQTDNVGSLLYRKRKTRNNYDVVCPIVIDVYSPTACFTYDSLIHYEALHSPFSSHNNEYGRSPVQPQYVVAMPEIADNEPMLGEAYENPAANQYSNRQLDEIISAIIRKHSDFLSISTQRDKPLVDPPKEQREQTIYFLKSLLTDWGDSNWLDDKSSIQ